jgi:hypothetical protein
MQRRARRCSAPEDPAFGWRHGGKKTGESFFLQKIFIRNEKMMRLFDNRILEHEFHVWQYFMRRLHMAKDDSEELDLPDFSPNWFDEGIFHILFG